MTSATGRDFVPFAYGFRPFFLLAGVYAVVAMSAWLWLYPLGPVVASGIPPQLWHGHEMIFGFIAAAIAGFMLTAVPSWTGGRGFAGRPLMLLAALWLLGRLAVSFAGPSEQRWLLLAELAFLPAVIVTLAPSLLGKRSRNSPLLLVLLLFWIADAVFVTAVLRADAALAGNSLRAALNLTLVLITVIGGRIVPAFTGNALRARGADVTLRRWPAIEGLAVAATLCYAIADTVAPLHWVTASIAAIAALTHAVRLSGWHGHRTVRMPIVCVLHVAYLWLPLGLAMKALHSGLGLNWAAYWMHALGAGAAGMMIMAVMTRAALGHTGRPLIVRPAVACAYGLLVLAVVLRVFGPALLPVAYTTTLILSGGLWLAAFLVFVVIYAPILTRPRADGQPG